MKKETLLPFLVISILVFMGIYGFSYMVNYSFLLKIDAKDAMYTNLFEGKMFEKDIYVSYVRNFVDDLKRGNYSYVYENILDENFKKRTYANEEEFAEKMKPFFYNSLENNTEIKIKNVSTGVGSTNIEAYIEIIYYDEKLNETLFNNLTINIEEKSGYDYKIAITKYDMQKRLY